MADCDDATTPQDFSSVRHPLFWVVWDPGDGLGSRSYALQDINGDSFIEPRLLNADSFRRALAGPTFDYEVGRFSIQLADHDREIRGLLSSGLSRFFTKRFVGAYLGSQDDPAAVPYTVGNGMVTDSPGFDGLTVSLVGRDCVGEGVRWNMETQIPKLTIQRTHFTSAPADALGKGVPIVLGKMSASRHPAGTNVPTITGNLDKDRQAWDAGGSAWTMGWGDELGPAPPTALNMVENVGGGSLSDDVPGAKYYAHVWSVDANGVAGDPSPFHTDDLWCSVSGATSSITVSWTVNPAAAGYRVAFGWWYSNRFWCTQILDTTGSSVTFTANPAWQTPASQSNITPGATLSDGGKYGYFTITARYTDGETDAFAPVAFHTSPGWDRMMRLEWADAGSPLSYYIYQRYLPTGDYTARVEVDASVRFYDFRFSDLAAWEQLAAPARASGAVPTIYTGIRTFGGVDYHEFLYAGHPVDDTLHWYYDDGTNPVEIDQDEGSVWWVMNQAHWSAISTDPYVQVLGSDGTTIRYCAVYGAVGDGTGKADLVAAGSATLTVDVWGLEDYGNGSGDVIEDLYLQCCYFLNYFAIGDGTGVRPATPPMFPDSSVCRVYKGSFTAVSTMRKAEITGGITGGAIIGVNGERSSLSEILKRFMESGEFRIGPNKHWQIAAFAIDKNLQIANLDTIEGDLETHISTFRPEPKLDELENDLTYRYSYDHVASAWGSDNQRAPHGVSIANYQLVQTGDASYYFLRSGTIASFIVSKRQERVTTVPIYVSQEGPLKWLKYDVGDYVRITDFKGIGAQGWTGRVMWIVGITILPIAMRVQLEMLDVTGIINPAYAAVTAAQTGVVGAYDYEAAPAGPSRGLYWSGDPGEDYVNGAAVYAVAGTGTAPDLSPSAANGEGWIETYIKFQSDPLNDNPFLPIIAPYSKRLDGKPGYPDINLVLEDDYAGGLKWRLEWNAFAGGDGGPVFSDSFTIASLLDGDFHRIRIEWKCGTTSGSAAPPDDVDSDGYITITMDGVTLFDQQNISLWMNPYAASASELNRFGFLALGFYGFAGIYDDVSYGYGATTVFSEDFESGAPLYSAEPAYWDRTMAGTTTYTMLWGAEAVDIQDGIGR